MKKLLLLTGPQGSGNHIFSRIFSWHPEVKGWDAILKNYWVPTDEDFFSKYFVNPEELKEEYFEEKDYFVADISCPFVFDGNVTVPKIQEFINKVESFNIEVVVCIIVRDEFINTEQQKRLRGKKTLEIATDEYSRLTCKINFLSLESLFLYKISYLKWVSNIIDFPIDLNNPELFKFLENSPNQKYVKYVNEYWLDSIVKKGLRPFNERI